MFPPCKTGSWPTALWIPQTVQFSQHNSLSICACACFDTNSCSVCSHSPFVLLQTVVSCNHRERENLPSHKHTHYEVISERACALTQQLSLCINLCLLEHRQYIVSQKREQMAEPWCPTCCRDCPDSLMEPLRRPPSFLKLGHAGRTEPYREKKVNKLVDKEKFSCEIYPNSEEERKYWVVSKPRKKNIHRLKHGSPLGTL